MVRRVFSAPAVANGVNCQRPRDHDGHRDGVAVIVGLDVYLPVDLL